MSAINVIKQKAAVHVITDGASWYQDRSFGPAAGKAWQLPHLNAVVAVQAGSRLTALMVVDTLNMAGRTYDELKSNALEAIQTALVWRDQVALGPEPLKVLRIVIAGWSETKGPDGFIVVRNETGVFETGEVVTTAHTPANQKIVAAIRDAIVPNAPRHDDLVPERDGLAMIEVQRRIIDDRSAVPLAGAFAQLTSVTREGITTRILKTWPEDWGAPVIDAAKARFEA